MKEKEHIEFHSEPYQEIMGTIPSWITRWGVVLIFLIVLTSLIGCCIIRYPETIKGSFELLSDDSGVCYGEAGIKSTEIGKVSVGQDVNVKLTGFPYLEYGIVKGKIRNVSYLSEKRQDGCTYYRSDIVFPKGLQTTYGKELPFIAGMDGEVVIIIEERTIIKTLIAPFTSLAKTH